MALETNTNAPREKEVIKMNKEERHFYLKSIERMLREVERKMRALYPNFNDVPNAERFVISCSKANEALRQIQNGNTETVHKYWRDGE